MPPKAVNRRPANKAKPKGKQKGGTTRLTPARRPVKTPVIRTQQPGKKVANIRTPSPPICYSAQKGMRDYMEDTLEVRRFTHLNQAGTFYGVFDGHGGDSVSQRLADKTYGLFPFLVSTIKKLKNPTDDNLKRLITACYEQYDRRMYQQRKQFPAGSTAVVILHFNHKLYLINLGDSRAIAFTNDRLIATTDDHKPQKPKERTRIYDAGHYVNPFNIYESKSAKKSFNSGDIVIDKSTIPPRFYIWVNRRWDDLDPEDFRRVRSKNTEAQNDVSRVSNSLALSRAFGDFYLKVEKHPDGLESYLGTKAAVSIEPEIKVVDLKNYHGQRVHLLLASDGFWDVNRNTKQLRDRIINDANPKEMCQRLVHDAIYNKNCGDNTTVLYHAINP